MVALTVDSARTQAINEILEELPQEERRIARACLTLVKGRRPSPKQVAEFLRKDPKKVKEIHSRVWELLRRKEAVHLLPTW